MPTIAAGRWGRPEELGHACAFLCSAQAGFISRQNLQLDGGLRNSGWMVSSLRPGSRRGAVRPTGPAHRVARRDPGGVVVTSARGALREREHALMTPRQVSHRGGGGVNRHAAIPNGGLERLVLQ